MRIIGAISAICCLAFVMTPRVLLAESKFSAEESKGEFIVKHRGRTLISGDSLNLLDKGFAAATSKVFNPAPDNKVFHVLGCENGAEYLKELSETPGNVELNVLVRTLPGTSKFEYSFAVPAEFLEGCKYEALIGSTSSAKWVSGSFPADNLTSVRFISIDGPDKKLFIDLNPLGVLDHYGTYSGTWGYDWYIRRSGDVYRFGYVVQGKQIGVSEMKKVIIGEGPADFKTIHPILQKAYTEPLPVEHFITFGGSAAPANAVPFKLGVFSSETGHGWARKYDNIHFRNSGFKGPISGQYAAGSGDADFKFKVVPGHYVLSLTFGSADGPLGPFDVSVNGVKKAQNVTCDKGVYDSLAISAVTDENELTIGFSGTWAVTSLLLQPYLSKAEDYVFRRNWWVVQEDVPPFASRPVIAR